MPYWDAHSLYRGTFTTTVTRPPHPQRNHLSPANVTQKGRAQGGPGEAGSKETNKRTAVSGDRGSGRGPRWWADSGPLQRLSVYAARLPLALAPLALDTRNLPNGSQSGPPGRPTATSLIAASREETNNNNKKRLVATGELMRKLRGEKSEEKRRRLVRYFLDFNVPSTAYDGRIIRSGWAGGVRVGWSCLFVFVV